MWRGTVAPVHALSIVTTVAEGLLPMTALAIKFLMDLARLVAQEACEISIAAARAELIICCHLSSDCCESARNFAAAVCDYSRGQVTRGKLTVVNKHDASSLKGSLVAAIRARAVLFDARGSWIKPMSCAKVIVSAGHPLLS